MDSLLLRQTRHHGHERRLGGREVHPEAFRELLPRRRLSHLPRVHVVVLGQELVRHRVPDGHVDAVANANHLPLVGVNRALLLDLLRVRRAHRRGERARAHCPSDEILPELQVMDRQTRGGARGQLALSRKDAMRRRPIAARAMISGTPPACVMYSRAHLLKNSKRTWSSPRP